MHVQSVASASASAQGSSASAQARINRSGSDGPRHHREHSGGPKRSGGPGRSNGLHLGQIKRLIGEISHAMEGAAADNAGSAGGAGSTGSATSTSQVDIAALQVLTGRLGDVMDRLGGLTDLVNQAIGGATTSSTAGGTTTGTTSSTASTSQINLLFPFQGPTDFGSITINGVTTEFGIIDATGGLSARQVTGSLVNIINSDPDQTVTAQQRDNKILLVAKEAGATITVDDISFGSTSDTTGGFAGFLDGMSGSGTLMSNPISPIRQ